MATSGLLFEMLKVFKVLILLGIFGLACIGYGYGFGLNQSTTEGDPIILKDFFVHNSSNVNCDKIVYSENWTLSYLREIARLCSNGQ